MFVQFLNAFVRRADVVNIACIAQSVNLIASVTMWPDGLILQTIHFPMAAFAKHLVSGSCSISPVIEPPTSVAGERGEVSALDVFAAFDPASGEVSVFFVKRDQANAIATRIRFGDRRATSVVGVTQLAGDDPRPATRSNRPTA